MEHPYRIGLRTIKTGIAVSLTILVCRLIHTDYPFYAVVATIISMDRSVVNSLKAGLNRMLGTFIGAVLGVIVVFIQPESAILTGLAIMVLIYVCNMMKWNGSIVISGTVLVIIMFNLNGRDPFIYSLSRLFDTFVGISVAVLVNTFIAPQNYERKVIQLNLELHRLFDLFLEGNEYDLNEIERCYNEFVHALNMYDHEIRFFRKYKDEIRLIKDHALFYPKVMNHLRALSLAKQEDSEDIIKIYHTKRAYAYITKIEEK